MEKRLLVSNVQMPIISRLHDNWNEHATPSHGLNTVSEAWVWLAEAGMLACRLTGWFILSTPSRGYWQKKALHFCTVEGDSFNSKLYRTACFTTRKVQQNLRFKRIVKIKVTGDGCGSEQHGRDDEFTRHEAEHTGSKEKTRQDVFIKIARFVHDCP